MTARSERQKMMAEIDRLDMRRQTQIANQRAIIERLAIGEHSADVMVDLAERLSTIEGTIREIHYAGGDTTVYVGTESKPVCAADKEVFPCRTYRAVFGEKSSGGTTDPDKPTAER